MPSISKCLVFLALAVSTSALTTPNVVRNMHHHRAIAAQIVEPVAELPLAPEGSGAGKTLRRRRGNKSRCNKSSSDKSSITKATGDESSSTGAATTTAIALKASVVGKVAATPSVAPKGKASKASSTHTSSGSKSTGKSIGGKLPSFMTGTQTGQGTFYGTGLGACGITNKDTDKIAAVSHLLFDAFPGYNGANPNNNPLCGRKVTAHYKGKSVTVAVTDRCQGCAVTDLDFAPAAFNEIADPATGRISGMTWEWA